jgi:hypothetical protein
VFALLAVAAGRLPYHTASKVMVFGLLRQSSYRMCYCFIKRRVLRTTRKKFLTCGQGLM